MLSQLNSTADFHYYLGELSEIFSGLEKFDSNHVVYVYCDSLGAVQSIKKITVTQATNSTFYVEMGWNCKVYTRSQDERKDDLEQIADFNITGKIEVLGYPNEKTIEYWAKNFTLKTLSVDDSFRYKLLDKAKA